MELTLVMVIAALAVVASIWLGNYVDRKAEKNSYREKIKDAEQKINKPG